MAAKGPRTSVTASPADPEPLSAGDAVAEPRGFAEDGEHDLQFTRRSEGLQLGSAGGGEAGLPDHDREAVGGILRRRSEGGRRWDGDDAERFFGRPLNF